MIDYQNLSNVADYQIGDVSEPVLNIDTVDIDFSELLRRYHLDFEVQKVPIYTKAPVYQNGQVIGYENLNSLKVATVRYDDGKPTSVLGIVSPKYEVIQNYDKISVFEKGLRTGLLVPENAFAAEKGKRIVFQCRVKSLDFDVKRKDPVRSYATLISSHDGTLQIIITYTMIRVFCENRMRLVIAQAKGRKGFDNNVYVIKHTKSAIKRMQEVKEYYNFIYTQKALVSQVFDKMYDTKISSEKQIDEYLKSVFSSSLLSMNSEGSSQSILNGKTSKNVYSDSEEGIFGSNRFENVEELKTTNDSTDSESEFAEELDDISTRTKNLINDVKEFIQTGPGQKEIPEMNVWKVFNGVTGYMQHAYRFRSRKSGDSPNLIREESLLFGNAFKINQRAFEKAISLINN